MKATLSTLIEKARSVRMTDAQRTEQRISFAFGNIHLAGGRATRQDVRRAAQQIPLR
jgi:hypothetical protein